MVHRLLLISLCSASFLVACGTKSAEPNASSEPDSTLVLRTDEGSVVTFDDFKVTCPGNAKSQWGQDAQVVQAVAGAYGGAAHEEQDGMIFTAKAGITTRVSLPHGEEYGRHKTFITAFVSRATDASELSAGEDGSRGRIEVIEATCAPTPRLELKIDAELVSEDGDGSAEVKGHVRFE